MILFLSTLRKKIYYLFIFFDTIVLLIVKLYHIGWITSKPKHYFTPEIREQIWQESNQINYVSLGITKQTNHEVVMHRSIRSFNIPSPLSLSNPPGKSFASKLTSEETAIRFTSDIYISNFVVNIWYSYQHCLYRCSYRPYLHCIKLAFVYLGYRHSSAVSTLTTYSYLFWYLQMIQSCTNTIYLFIKLFIYCNSWHIQCKITKLK